MSEPPNSSMSGSEKQRSTTRMRFVGPPGMKLATTSVKTVGRYEILKTLGKGAMGVVYKARDPLLDRIVAVKTIMSPQGAGKRVRSAYIERFQREAKAAAKMQHPSIVTIFDIGVESGAPFMVLEYLPGESLADRLDRVRLPLGKAVQIGLDLANALAFAHRQRIVHRDVKPANVLHAGENRWKLADFGIARLPDSDLTQIGIFMGTPGYSPPEAIKQGKYTAQADVFAWGAVLYELLSGRIPYEGPDTKTTNGYVMRGIARDVRDHDPSIPVPLAEVTMRALAGSADERFQGCDEVEDALRKAWEFCLNAGMIPPGCLTGEEVPHERVGREMHQGVIAKAPPAALSESDIPRPQMNAGNPVLVIESGKSQVSDDAPTNIMNMPGGAVRDSGNIGAPIDPPIGKKKPSAIDLETTANISSDTLGKPADIDETSTTPRTSNSSNTLLWVALVVLTLAAGAMAFLLLRG